MPGQSQINQSSGQGIESWVLYREYFSLNILSSATDLSRPQKFVT